MGAGGEHEHVDGLTRTGGEDAPGYSPSTRRCVPSTSVPAPQSPGVLGQHGLHEDSKEKPQQGGHNRGHGEGKAEPAEPVLAQGCPDSRPGIVPRPSAAFPWVFFTTCGQIDGGPARTLLKAHPATLQRCCPPRHHVNCSSSEVLSLRSWAKAPTAAGLRIPNGTGAEREGTGRDKVLVAVPRGEDAGSSPVAIPGVSGMLGVEEARVILVSEHRAARQTSKHRVSVAGFSQSKERNQEPGLRGPAGLPGAQQHLHGSCAEPLLSRGI
ncbi:hypothetical protein Anapl_10880 [Anas platyrhynchos]|uniref:Uncharacterized protein n=1 Tax=Anas platyrhynchos TaxID=8839 RepID=R0L889_ANAPL|nr:hypothetical protein Anapl_10880 [Anas platyrhynchos]